MPSNDTPQKKTAAKKAAANPPATKNTVAKKASPTGSISWTTSVPPAKRTVVPRTRPQIAVPATREPVDPGEISGTRLDAEAVIGKYRSDRRRRRRLLALKITSYVLVACFVMSVGLTIWQLTIPSVLAGAYVGLAALCATSIGICVTLYHRCKHDQDGNA
ncbi:hypothetical protein ACIOTI_41480 [Streptomyces sp. NPDC087843]|uniref:hypothetical protein n=1 Tax=Streptomyces sp. NPDC087843 TaxID=3365804 RepID=UPI003820700C